MGNQYKFMGLNRSLAGILMVATLVFSMNLQAHTNLPTPLGSGFNPAESEVVYSPEVAGLSADEQTLVLDLIQYLESLSEEQLDEGIAILEDEQPLQLVQIAVGLFTCDLNESRACQDLYLMQLLL